MGCLKSKPAANVVTPLTVSSSNQDIGQKQSKEKHKKVSKNKITPIDDHDNKESRKDSSGEAKIQEFSVPSLQFTKKQISEQNAACQRTRVLIPITGIVYDLTKMYNDVSTSQNLGLRPKYAKQLQTQLTMVKENPSSYLGLISTCKYLGMKRQVLKTIQNQCALGRIVEASMEEEQTDFEENLFKIFEDSIKEMEENSLRNDDSSSLESVAEMPSYFIFNMELFRENCNKLIGKKITFSHKAFDPVTGYQGKTEFPLPPWRRSVELRSYLWYPYMLREDGYYKSLLKPLEERKEELIEDMNNLIQSVEELNIDFFYWGSHISEEIAKLCHDYHLHYWETFSQSCKFQLKNLTMLKNHEHENTDINMCSYPLPGYVKEEDMRHFLLVYSPLEFNIPDDGYAWEHVTELDVCKTDPKEVHEYFCEIVSQNRHVPFDTEIDSQVAWTEVEQDVIKKDTSGAKDVHSYFCDLVASGRYDFMGTEIDGDVAWDEMERDVIKIDKATEAQEAVLKSRASRKDLHDLERMKKRRDKLFKYFQISNESETYVEYSGWAERLTEGFQLFQDLCKGKYKPTPRQPVDKEVEKEKQYRYALSQVTPFTIEEKKFMKQKREAILLGFLERHNLDPGVFQQYSSWGNRMEENERKLKALCNSKKHAEIVTRLKEGKGFLKNFEAIWVHETVFDETADSGDN